MGSDPIMSGSLTPSATLWLKGSDYYGVACPFLGLVGGRWEISLARKLRGECGTGCAWLAIRMRYSSASFIRKLLSEN
jgi:hypothetical protein